jgi:hypothetical protein
MNMTPADVDKAIASLHERICPTHNIAMKEIAPFTHPDMQYVRHRFRCLSPECRCEVDIVGDEIKTDSIERSLDWLICMESLGEFVPQQYR